MLFITVGPISSAKILFVWSGNNRMALYTVDRKLRLLHNAVAFHSNGTQIDSRESIQLDYSAIHSISLWEPLVTKKTSKLRDLVVYLFRCFVMSWDLASWIDR